MARGSSSSASCEFMFATDLTEETTFRRFGLVDSVYDERVGLPDAAIPRATWSWMRRLAECHGGSSREAFMVEWLKIHRCLGRPSRPAGVHADLPAGSRILFGTHGRKHAVHSCPPILSHGRGRPRETGQRGRAGQPPRPNCRVGQPALAGYAIQTISLGLPLELAAFLQGINALLYYLFFRRIQPPEEREPVAWQEAGPDTSDSFS